MSIPYTKVTRDDAELGHVVAVLVSPGYGAGWYSWMSIGESEDCTWTLFHQDIVNAVLRNASSKELTDIITKICADAGVDLPYFGGLRDITVEWVPVGKQFYIHEYDGYESIMFVEDHRWITA